MPELELATLPEIMDELGKRYEAAVVISQARDKEAGAKSHDVQVLGRGSFIATFGLIAHAMACFQGESMKGDLYDR